MHNRRPSRYPFVETIVDRIFMVIMIAIVVGVIWITAKIYKFFYPDISTFMLIIIIPLTYFVLYWVIGITTDIIRFIKDCKAKKANKDNIEQ